MRDFYVCDEMMQFRDYLDKRGIDWRDNSSFDTPTWICRTHFYYDGKLWSVIHGYGTYGGISTYSNIDCERLEAYDGVHEPTGFLSANECVILIFGVKNHG